MGRSHPGVPSHRIYLSPVKPPGMAQPRPAQAAPVHAQVRSPWYFEGVPQGLLVSTVADERPVASSVTDRSLPPRSSTVFCLQCSSVSQWTCGYMVPRTHGNSPGVRKSVDSNTTNSWEPAHGLRGRTEAVSGTRLSLGRHGLIVLRWTLIALGNAILSCNVQHYFTRLKLCRWFYTYPYVVFLSFPCCA